MLKFIQYIDPLMENIRLHMSVLISEYAEEIMTLLGNRVNILQTSYDEDFSGHFDRYNHLMTNLMCIDLVVEVETVYNTFTYFFKLEL